jgi:anti-sigma factor RsiW
MSMRHQQLGCDELVELVTDYLEGALSDEERTRFEMHLVGCVGCTRYLEQMRDTIGAVGRLEAEAVEAEAMADLLVAFRGWRAAREGR